MPTLNVANRTLFHGDNRLLLRGINSGTVHLIATDPPFNKGRDSRVVSAVLDDPFYLELDHTTPRSDGGLSHISNRLLLCGPCNRIKSNRLTLSGLWAENQRRGRMAAGTQ